MNAMNGFTQTVGTQSRLSAAAFADRDLRERTLACWRGKAIGGSLGQSFEGLDGPLLEVEFYEPLPDGMVPNDDLDIQVVYAMRLAAQPRAVVDRDVLTDAWRHNIQFPFNEYGVAKRNIANGLRPPLTGAYDNWFTCGEGGAIRTELWACLAAGDPDLAGRFAYEDACIDHAGDGIWAAVFLARLQAAAFVLNDKDDLLDTALGALPTDSKLRAAIADTRAWAADHDDWLSVRSLILQRYEHEDFTNVRQNCAFAVLGWLAGNDFAERILICNNCGKDTDSSTASLGALLGILDPAGIPERWSAPIGSALVLSPEIAGITPPADIEGFTDIVLDLRQRVQPPPARTHDVSHVLAPPGDLGIEMTVGFTRFWERPGITHRFLPPASSPAPVVSGRRFTAPGTWLEIEYDDFIDDAAVLTYRFAITEPGRHRIMVNTTEDCRVWLDDGYLFGRETGGLGEPARMFPTPHMPPLNQFSDIELIRGDHTLTIALRRPSRRRTAEVLVGIADGDTHQWLPYPWLPPIPETPIAEGA